MNAAIAPLAWIRIGGRASPHALRWREILDGPPDAIARILTDEGEDATALRQSTPFAGALDAAHDSGSTDSDAGMSSAT